jgi:hypothetical protein
VRRRVRLALGMGVAVVSLVVLVALSRVPFEALPGDHALIRLSWRTVGSYVEECRRLTPEELERLPVHMRREEICEGRMLSFRLRVTLDERVVLEEVILPAGARGDRPLFVLREIAVPPGEHRLRVEWSAEGGGDDGHLDLEAILRLASREISLVTYDVDRRSLVLRGHGHQLPAAP